MDNVFIERLWRSLKHECVYLRGFHSRAAEQQLSNWLIYYNHDRPHSSLEGRTLEKQSRDIPPLARPA